MWFCIMLHRLKPVRVSLVRPSFPPVPVPVLVAIPNVEIQSCCAHNFVSTIKCGVTSRICRERSRMHA